MNKQKLFSAAAGLAAAATLLAAPAHADGLYVGASLGVPHFGDGGVNGIGGNGSGVSGNVFGGWQFTPNYALEAGLADLGRISNGSGDVRSHGQYLDAVGLLPVTTSWSLLGSVGVAHLQLNTSNGDTSSDALKLGLGAEYKLSDHLALRGEWQRYRPEDLSTRVNVDQYVLGVRYAF